MITLFQCIPVYKAHLVVRLMNFLFERNCMVHLDLEDSIQDIEHPEFTPGLKSNARKDFEVIAKHFPSKKFCVRINSVRGNEFIYDLILLKKFRDSIESVFIPKVESSNDLHQFYKETQHNFRVCLIIETRKGIDNLDEILSTAHRSNIDFIFFGNYDYHLDTNTYPINEQHSSLYWQTVEPIISKVEKHKLRFGNSPYANISDKPCLDFALAQLRNYCRNDFALMSLHKIQTLHLQELIRKNSPAPVSGYYSTDTVTRESFVRHKQKGRSFSYDGQRIITPHEYFLLRNKENG